MTKHECIISDLITVPIDTILNIIIFINIDAFLCLPIHGLEDRCPVELIIISQNRLNRLCRFHCMIMWHGGEQMVCNVRIRYVMEHLV
ncbi:hypothetical protein Hanom_Chr13g01199461 [Helianthus anomalus]